jgi:hypothetical protein
VGIRTKGEKDMWILEYAYLKQARAIVKCLNDLKEMLLKFWTDGKDKELERIKSIKAFYDDIILNNKKVFGTTEV